jgi:hypothetical protein
MKKIFLGLSLLLSLFLGRIFAHEGMWIPLFLGELNETQMKKMGMKISAEDIYSINNSSLKDAIAIFGRGCTSEVISQDGLLLTNHHCGYRQIQSHSSLEHDYLTEGFWAMSKEEELANPGLTVTFLVKMEEVTEAVLLGVEEGMDEIERAALVAENLLKLKAENTSDNGIDVKIKPFFAGNRYFMFFYEVFKDIRLVGAPPSNIGKFGGDTDNWMWPRHTGDFSLFRIYANKDNKPAKYSKDNVPYKPKKHLTISLEGIEKGDFTFVYGYPANTKEYLISDAVELITEKENPIKIDLRTKKLNVMKAAQNADPKVRIQYASKVASLANGWKKWQGENKGVKRMDAINQKRLKEEAMIAWMEENPRMKEKYDRVIPEYRLLYKDYASIRQQYQYYAEAGMGIELLRFASRFRKLIEELSAEEPNEVTLADQSKKLKVNIELFFKDYYQAIDEKVAVFMIEGYLRGVEKDNLPEYFKTIEDKFSNDSQKFVDYLFEKSIFSNEDAILEIIEEPNKKTLKKISKDPAYQFAMSLRKKFNELRESSKELTSGLSTLNRKYMQMQMDFEPDKIFYPDANSTLRVSYGKVDGYFPRDGVYYQHFTTLEGIMEKEDPDIYDYVVENRLKVLYKEQDYGPYASKSGEMNVCFTASNHTTGGNSGSPVFNANGHLIGINFDRNWEGTMSDIVYDPDQCRNITLDIRYCLFIIDKYAEAGHLVDEMSIIE